ncbi:ABC transporter [Tepiditoga spiralis]|uniref:ABC transporter n=1 Tax=Tepiditoga spiralis TaxID=2108365 RepID=A0A7G1G5Q0_9BACT|nr:ABC transporter ATP-binding protein [Tepiditoga spiralis]BBE31920.1 ABC transporter [Tepiditoga spiralis]
MKKIFKYLKKYKLLIFFAFFCMIAGIILDMINPYLMKIMVDDVLIGNKRNLLKTVLLGIAGISLSRALLGYLREFTFDYIGGKVQGNIRKDLFKHIQSLHFGFFDKMNTGELMSRIGNDIDNIWSLVGFGMGLLIENILYFITASSIIFFLNWKLALISLLTTPLIAYLAFEFEKKIGEAFEKISDQNAEINTTAQENISGVRLVKAFTREKYEIKKFLTMNEKNYDLNVEKLRIWGRYFPLIEFLSDLSVVLVVVFGGMMVIGEKLSIGTLISFSQYIWMLIWPMREIGWLFNMFSESKASAKKINKIFDTKPEIFLNKETNNLNKETFKGHVIFKNVSFKYEDEYILKNINLEAKPGNTIAIMGPTGSGKTTLINLISRFYEVSEGEITFDGYNVKDIPLNILRKNIANVFQDNFLFSESVKENIKFVNKNESINEAIKLSCSNFVYNLKEKENTIIGERGIGLSGGQKQRLTIARAFNKNSKVLILDDATSALDMDTEFELLKNLKKLPNKVTTFIIGHRISAVKNADEIIFIENGEIVERGTHDELLQKKGKYYEIYEQQFKDFKEIKEVL